jgi:hypothetical protein
MLRRASVALDGGGALTQSERMQRGLACLSALLLSGCASSFDASYEPLVCDEASGDEVAFVFHQSTGFFAPYGPHGRELLVIDGSCRFHAYGWSGGPAGVLRSGRLTEGELEALNEELLTADYRALDGEEVSFGTGADGWTTTLRRDGLEAQCYEDCGAHDALAVLEARSYAWAGRLWDRGAPVDGAVDIDVFGPTSADGLPSEPWTGRADLAALVADSADGAYAHVRIDDMEDVALLRALRASAEPTDGAPLHLTQGDAVFAVGVADVLPFELALHEDRPYPF